MLVNELVRVVAENLGEGDQHPLAVFPAALPYFSVRVSAICVERRELDVFQEFMLRAIQLGFGEAGEVSAFLGADVDEVQAELKVLQEELFVSRAQDRVVLMEKGIAYLSSAGLRRTCEREAGCYVNGVTRKIEPATEGLFPRRRLPNGTLALPPIPARPPRIGEIEVEGVKIALQSTRSALPRVLEIARLGRIVRTSSLFLSGYLLLRRGKHGVPIICSKGSPISEYARILGGHPSIQSLKTMIEAEEKRVRAMIRKRASLGLNVKAASAQLIRKAVTEFIRASEVGEKEKAVAQNAFIDASSDVFRDKETWINLVEFHLLFAMWSMRAKTSLSLLLPRGSPVFPWTHLQILNDLVVKGIRVEIIATADALKMLTESELLHGLVANQISFVCIDDSTEFSGFSVDNSTLVLGVVKELSSSMGVCTTFFGVVVSPASDSDKMLTAVSAVSAAREA